MDITKHKHVCSLEQLSANCADNIPGSPTYDQSAPITPDNEREPTVIQNFPARLITSGDVKLTNVYIYNEINDVVDIHLYIHMQ